MTGTSAQLEPGQVLCPYCLEIVVHDERALHVRNEKLQYERLDTEGLANPLRRADVLRGAFQLCGNTEGVSHHYIPVPYLTHGRPLTVAMVGTSGTGKSHLLTQMIAEVTDGGLEPYGVRWQSVNPADHSDFMRERVALLRAGEQLEATAQTPFAQFVEALLLTGTDGEVRPVAFFDLGGEDLVRTDSLLRFLLGVDALIFVADPLLACGLPQLDEAREQYGLHVSRSDPAFETVLDRLPRQGPYLDVAMALVVGKADLLRFEPPVDRWLSRPSTAPLDARRLREESRDVYAFLRRHAAPAWLRPFDSALRCTLHFASATGGQPANGRFPHGVRSRRVLGPLLSILAMCGLLSEDPALRPSTVGM
ncbi:hypothetical protein [Streptomyces sp. ALI-76-A]|uniref:hypothetical protein n=1 Tax=Streptomyces sp. ALI-76-A TaxID=3025736 RepID=UPI00256E9C86|nr:hypothetical protein [Streptomyces sp. ALI-76-A]MDL5205248.1 hypothetical protein [Streptomyces sp. ALI-76-A]